jgi:putative transcriptional regulator
LTIYSQVGYIANFKYILFDYIAVKSDNCVMLDCVKLALDKIVEEKKKSLYALAKETGISYSTIHKMATKEVQSIDLEVLRKICENLKCTPNDLIVF